MDTNMPQSNLLELVQSDRLAELLIPPIYALRKASVFKPLQEDWEDNCKENAKENDQLKSIHLDFVRRGLKTLVGQAYRENLKLAYTYSRGNKADNSANGENKIHAFKEDLARAILDEVVGGYGEHLSLFRDEKKYILRPYSNIPTNKVDNPHSSDIRLN